MKTVSWATCRYITLILFILLGSHGAFGQDELRGAYGIFGLPEASLLTELNLSQTINDVTVKLEWAYVDENQLAIGYSFTPPEESDEITYDANIIISDANDSYMSSGTSMAITVPQSMSAAVPPLYIGIHTLSFSDVVPETLQMRVAFTLEAEPPPAPSLPFGPLLIQVSDVTGIGDLPTEAVHIINRNDEPADITSWTIADESGNLFRFPALTLEPGASVDVFTRAGENTPTSLYWGKDEAIWNVGERLTLATANSVMVGYHDVGGLTPRSGIHVNGYLSLQNPIGPFSFQFDLPVVPALELTPNQFVTVEDTTVSLETLSITPSSIAARFCYEMPDERGWVPVINLSIGDAIITPTLLNMDMPSAETATLCGTHVFFASPLPQPVTLRFSVDELYVYLVSSGQMEHRYGPWLFTVVLP